MKTMLLACLLAVGCGSSTTTSPSTTANAPPPHTAQCPMMKEMADAQVTATDTSDGVAVEFVTTGDVAALRAHVREMASMHEAKAAKHGCCAGGMHGMKMVPSQATVEDLPNGARMVLVPSDPSQLSDLRSHVREHAAMMSKGQCPMMSSHPAG